MITLLLLLIFSLGITSLQQSVRGDDTLLREPYRIVNSMVSHTGVDMYIPPSSGMNKGEFAKSINTSPFPTTSCIDRCHVNYLAYHTMYQKKVFRHKAHSPDKGLGCHQCHNNDPVNKKTHGNLVIQNKDCWICHHKKLKDNGDCLKCHSEVKQYINGSIQNIGTKVPDWMSNWVSCTDCHRLESHGNSFKSVRKYCIECHNPDYGLLYDAWKKVLDSKTKHLYQSGIHTPNIQNHLRLVQSYGMHNFRLSQMILKSIEPLANKEKWENGGYGKK